MDFGRQNNQNQANIDSLKNQLSIMIQPLLVVPNPDSRQIFEQIKNKLGIDNIDEIMVTHAIDVAISELSKINPKDEKKFSLELRKKIELIVNWSLIKVKSTGNKIGLSEKSDTSPVTFGSGTDVVVLKDFNIK